MEKLPKPEQSEQSEWNKEVFLARGHLAGRRAAQISILRTLQKIPVEQHSRRQLHEIRDEVKDIKRLEALTDAELVAATARPKAPQEVTETVETTVDTQPEPVEIIAPTATQDQPPINIVEAGNNLPPQDTPRRTSSHRPRNRNHRKGKDGQQNEADLKTQIMNKMLHDAGIHAAPHVHASSVNRRTGRTGARRRR